jgi:hypothetical protein
MVIVSLQIALALLPLTLGPDSSHGDAFATELKAALRAYWAVAFHDSAWAGDRIRERWAHIGRETISKST